MTTIQDLLQAKHGVDILENDRAGDLKTAPLTYRRVKNTKKDGDQRGVDLFFCNNQEAMALLGYDLGVSPKSMMGSIERVHNYLTLIDY